MTLRIITTTPSSQYYLFLIVEFTVDFSAQSGKTTLANFLSEAGEVGNSAYRPTKGCRIVEFEVPNLEVGGTSHVATAEVELWDISGDKR